MKSNIREITKIVSIDINGQSIAAQGTYTEIIDVERDDWEIAFVTLWNKDRSGMGVYGEYKRLSAFLVLTNDYDDAFSQASRVHRDVVYPYPATLYYYIHNHRYRGYSYAVDSMLSSNYGFSSNGFVRIERGRINGTDVEIEFFNTSFGSSVMYLEGRIKLQRTVVT